jgi:CBS domain-containing protein
VLHEGASGDALVELAERHGVREAMVVDAEGRYRGTITSRELQSALLNREALAVTVAADLMRTDVPVTHEDESMEVAFQKLAAKDVDSIPVVEPRTRRLLGVLTRERLMQAYADELAREA